MKQLRGIARTICAINMLALSAGAQPPASPTNATPSETTAHAEDAGQKLANSTKDSNSGPADIKSYFGRTIKFSGVIRARYESTLGKDFSSTAADSYLLTRTRLGIAFLPTTWLRFYAEAQDARAIFYKTKPGSAVSDPFDLRQAYVEGGAIEGNGFRIRAGRQELLLGSGRLITSGDWTLTKAFDIARTTFTTSKFKLDVLGGSQVLLDQNRMDRDRPGERFYAAYSTFSSLIPGASVEPYLMAKTALNVKDKTGKLGKADTLYAGGRLIGKWRPIDYNFEGVREAGSYSNDSVRAWGYATGAGLSISKRAWQPHISSDYLYASGDSGIKDGTHQSFDFLYGAQQPITSMTGQFAWRNIRDWRAGVDFTPLRRLKIKVDYRDYWLATTMDGLYNASGTRTVFNAKATSSHVGEGVDVLAVLSLNRKTTIGVGFGNLAPGSYLTQTGKTSGFLYPSIFMIRQL